MTIDVGNGEFEAGPDNAMLLAYENDMMDGLFVDLDEQFCFISADTEGFEDLKEQVIEEGIPIGGVGADFDPESYPHQFIIKSLGVFTVQAAEKMTADPEPHMPVVEHSKELMYGRRNGLELRLGWIVGSDALELRLIDEIKQLDITFIVPPDKGLDAFNHPYNYIPTIKE